MNYKKLVTILGITVIAGGVFTGCSSKEPDAVEPAIETSVESSEASAEMIEISEVSTETDMQDLIDGIYRVEYGTPNEEGWKAFLETTVVDGQITGTVFDEVNESGELNTDNDAAQDELEVALVQLQDPMQIEDLADEPELSETFQTLAMKAVEQAVAGNTGTTVIE